MEKIRNLSIRKTIVLYLTASLIVGFLAGAAITEAAGRAQKTIWSKYIDIGKYEKAVNGLQKNYAVDIPRIDSGDMTKADNFRTELCDFLGTYSILITCFISMIVAVILFYKKKIAIPLAELTAASEMIVRNELDFQITFKNEDELGRLCSEFEKMRASLASNNSQLWKMIEEETALRNAIAHDIRSPLAVLRGYQEMLLEFIPQETFGQPKTMEMLQAGMLQIQRMEKFIETMQKLSSLKERAIENQKIRLSDLTEAILSTMEILKKETGKAARLIKSTPDRPLSADPGLILEVADNLLANAFRYAERTVKAEILATNTQIELIISDDGCGFSDSPEKVTEAYYHANPQDDLKHFGLGMYISRIYCEKHGGRLLIANHVDGGAKVRAIFQIGE